MGRHPSGSPGRDISVIDPYAARVVARVVTRRQPHGVAIAPDGGAVYVSNEMDGTVAVIDPRSNAVTATFPVGDRPNQLEAAADGRQLFITLNASDGVAVSRDGRFLWLTTQTTGVATVIATEGHAVVAEVPVGKDPNWVALTPDDRIAVISNTASNDVTLVDARARRALATLPVGSGPKRLAVGVVRIDAAAQGGTP